MEWPSNHGKITLQIKNALFLEGRIPNQTNITIKKSKYATLFLKGNEFQIILKSKPESKKALFLDENEFQTVLKSL